MKSTNFAPKIAFALLAAVTAAALTGCGEEKKPEPVKAVAPPPPPSIEIKIGHVGPMTGGIAHLGKDNENGARLAVEEANAANIKIDGKDAKFVFIGEDDQADPKVGTTVAQKLVDAKVAGVVGHLNSGTSIPASTIYNQANIPVISGSATNPKLTEQGFKNQFRVVGRDDQQGPAIAAYLAGDAKPKVVAVVDDATAYGEGLANEVEKTLTAAKIKVLPREKGTDKTTDWKAILTKLKGKKPDAVFYGGMDATGQIAFDEKGDRKDAEMTIFTMKAGKITPVAVIKGGKTTPIADFIAAMAPPAPAAAPAPAPAPAPTAEASKEAPKAAEAAKEAPKADAMKK